MERLFYTEKKNIERTFIMFYLLLTEKNTRFLFQLKWLVKKNYQ